MLGTLCLGMCKGSAISMCHVKNVPRFLRGGLVYFLCIGFNPGYWVSVSCVSFGLCLLCVWMGQCLQELVCPASVPTLPPPLSQAPVC